MMNIMTSKFAVIKHEKFKKKEMSTLYQMIDKLLNNFYLSKNDVTTDSCCFGEEIICHLLVALKENRCIVCKDECCIFDLQQQEQRIKKLISKYDDIVCKCKQQCNGPNPLLVKQGAYSSLPHTNSSGSGSSSESEYEFIKPCGIPNQCQGVLRISTLLVHEYLHFFEKIHHKRKSICGKLSNISIATDIINSFSNVISMILSSDLFNEQIDLEYLNFGLLMMNEILCSIFSCIDFNNGKHVNNVKWIVVYVGEMLFNCGNYLIDNDYITECHTCLDDIARLVVSFFNLGGNYVSTTDNIFNQFCRSVEEMFNYGMEVDTIAQCWWFRKFVYLFSAPSRQWSTSSFTIDKDRRSLLDKQGHKTTRNIEH